MIIAISSIYNISKIELSKWKMCGIWVNPISLVKLSRKIGICVYSFLFVKKYIQFSYYVTTTVPIIFGWFEQL
jgi:hypothetical protein